MRLTIFSDYALRLLIYVASHEGRIVTIEEAARAFDISRAHLMKVANLLSRKGFLKATRGRHGGLRLARPANSIRLGEIVRLTEPDFSLVGCLAEGGTCRIQVDCRLQGIMGSALSAFLLVLDSHSLRDLVLDPTLFGIAPSLPS